MRSAVTERPTTSKVICTTMRTINNALCKISSLPSDRFDWPGWSSASQGATTRGARRNRLHHGKIEQVGQASQIRIPADYKTVTAKVVTPGLIDAHTVVGLAGYLNQPH